MKRFLEWVESQQLVESRKMYKGWIHPQTNKMEVWEAVGRPWHVQEVVKNPKLFGYTKEDLINAIVNSKVRSSRSGTVEDYYRKLVNGDSSVDWDIETLLVNDGWVKVTIDMSRGADSATDIYASDIQKARASLKMLEKKIPSLPEVQYMMVWTGDDMTRMTRAAMIQGEAHYKTFVKTGRIPVMRENLEESFDSPYPLKNTVNSLSMYKYETQTKAGKLEIDFFAVDIALKNWEVSFKIDGKITANTQAGEASRIIGTTLRAIELSLDDMEKNNIKKPQKVIISAMKSGKDAENKRHNIYTRVVERYAKKFGYRQKSVKISNYYDEIILEPIN